MLEQNKSTLIKISDLDRQDSKGNTLLHWAAEAGDVDLVQALIDHKVRVGLSNFAGETPFSKAASAGHLDVIKVFEKAGYEWRSDRSYQGQRSSQGHTCVSLQHSDTDGHAESL